MLAHEPHRHINFRMELESNMRLVMKQGNGTLEHGAAVVVAERVKQLKP